MFTFRCLSNRILTRSLISYRSRHLSFGAQNHETTTNEQYQSTINLIKEDLHLIHHDILQVSKTKYILSFLLLDISFLLKKKHGIIIVS